MPVVNPASEVLAQLMFINMNNMSDEQKLVFNAEDHQCYTKVDNKIYLICSFRLKDPNIVTLNYSAYAMVYTDTSTKLIQIYLDEAININEIRDNVRYRQFTVSADRYQELKSLVGTLQITDKISKTRNFSPTGNIFVNNTSLQGSLYGGTSYKCFNSTERAYDKILSEYPESL